MFNNSVIILTQDIESLGGYVQSKRVSEAILRTASSRGFRISVCRPGMIGPDTDTGAANIQDWFIRYISGAILLGGCRVSEPGQPVHLCPVNNAALVYLALSEHGTEVFHLPTCHTTVDNFMNMVQTATLQQARFVQWSARLLSSHP